MAIWDQETENEIVRNLATIASNLGNYSSLALVAINEDPAEVDFVKLWSLPETTMDMLAITMQAVSEDLFLGSDLEMLTPQELLDLNEMDEDDGDDE